MLARLNSRQICTSTLALIGCFWLSLRVPPGYTFGYPPLCGGGGGGGGGAGGGGAGGGGGTAGAGTPGTAGTACRGAGGGS